MLRIRGPEGHMCRGCCDGYARGALRPDCFGRQRGDEDRRDGGTAPGLRSLSMDTQTFLAWHTDEEWRRILTPEQFRVMRQHGTEAPGTCALLWEKRHGAFCCVGCGQKLFESTLKFESGTGWPSFNNPIEGAVETSVDRTYGMVRIEVHC